jgi:hypothetical protein
MSGMGHHVSIHVCPVPSLDQFQSVWVGRVSSRIEKKIQKYSDITAGVDFKSVSIEVSGVWGEQSLDFIKEVGCRIAAVTHKPCSTVFLRQRLSVAVQRGNAYYVLGTFRGVANDDVAVSYC